MVIFIIKRKRNIFLLKNLMFNKRLLVLVKTLVKVSEENDLYGTEEELFKKLQKKY